MTINYVYSIGHVDYVTGTYRDALKARQYTFDATGKIPTIYKFDADARKLRYVEVPDTALTLIA